MSASRSGETGALCSARFWSSLFCAALMPTSIGYQDIAALIAREQAPLSQWHLIVSPVQVTLHQPTLYLSIPFRAEVRVGDKTMKAKPPAYSGDCRQGLEAPLCYVPASYSRSIGSVIPQPLGLQTVNFDPRALDAYSWKIDEPIHTRPARQIEYPSVERSHKADRLPAAAITPALPAIAPASPAPLAPSGAEEAVTAPLAQPSPPQAELAPQPQPSPPQAEPAPPQSNTAAGDDEDVALADKPPDIPAPGETEYGPRPVGSSDQSRGIAQSGGMRCAPDDANRSGKIW